MTTFEKISTVFTALNILVVVTSVFVLPILYKKNSNVTSKGEEIRTELLSAFDKYMDVNQEVYNFEWYCAQINVLALKFSITGVRCMNCKKKTEWKEYINYFYNSARVVPELNNYSYSVIKIKFNHNFDVITCNKCEKKVKRFKSVK